jgi:hypothetical protein
MMDVNDKEKGYPRIPFFLNGELKCKITLQLPACYPERPSLLLLMKLIW